MAPIAVVGHPDVGHAGLAARRLGGDLTVGKPHRVQGVEDVPPGVVTEALGQPSRSVRAVSVRRGPRRCPAGCRHQIDRRSVVDRGERVVGDDGAGLCPKDVGAGLMVGFVECLIRARISVRIL